MLRFLFYFEKYIFIRRMLSRMPALKRVMRYLYRYKQSRVNRFIQINQTFFIQLKSNSRQDNNNQLIVEKKPECKLEALQIFYYVDLIDKYQKMKEEK